MPPSASNCPASPPDLDPVSAGKMNEIRGLVNYIEGNPAKSKADLAQKKAAKKARQREKKVSDMGSYCSFTHFLSLLGTRKTASRNGEEAET